MQTNVELLSHVGLGSVNTLLQNNSMFPKLSDHKNQERDQILSLFNSNEVSVSL